jgi:hypothetical protein
MELICGISTAENAICLKPFVDDVPCSIIISHHIVLYADSRTVTTSAPGIFCSLLKCPVSCRLLSAVFLVQLSAGQCAAIRN